MAKLRAKYIYEFLKTGDIKSSLGIGRIKGIKDFFYDLGIPEEDYTITEKSIVFPNNLDFYCVSDLKYLPDGMEVDGYMDLRRTGIRILPNRLKVKGVLYLNEIETLPPDLEANALDIPHGEIGYLPNNFTINKYLNLDYSHIESGRLPAGLRIGGNLYIRFTNISFLPPDLYVDKSIYLTGSRRIKEIPESVHIGDNIICNYSANKKLLRNIEASEKFRDKKISEE